MGASAVTQEAWSAGVPQVSAPLSAQGGWLTPLNIVFQRSPRHRLGHRVLHRLHFNENVREITGRTEACCVIHHNSGKGGIEFYLIFTGGF